MKISLNWVKEFTDVNLSVDELVTKIGAQLGEVEEVIDLGERYQGIVVANVVSCEKHPNADKLQVCKIDDGGSVQDVKRDANGYVQVVCGAPNVKAGMSVAWIPPGAIVPSSFDSEQFRLESRELRGVVSNGMLASGKELAINSDHEGILEVDQPTNPGTFFAEVYKLNDYIINVENKMFTHRPDCFGQLGVAREIAGIQGFKFTTPDWYLNAISDLASSDTQKLDFKIVNNLPELVPRFMIAPISNIKVQKSPIIMQSFLSRVGIHPVNNVVDITNTVMSLTAQPLHAYDYDKILALDEAKTAQIILRKPKKAETIALLNGKSISPHPDTIMIASQKHLIGVGGIMGGSATEVDFDSKNILLECANFDMYSIRRSSMANGLFTDAVTRLNKGQSSQTQDKVLAFAVAWISKLAGGQLAGQIADNKAIQSAKKLVEITPEFINLRLGADFSAEQIVNILENVEFNVEKTQGSLKITAPFWRTDIAIPEDIIEEVGRLYGYDKLRISLPYRQTSPTPENKLLTLKSSIRSILSAAGANEVLSYSFVHGKLLETVNQDKEQAFQLSNAISPSLQYYRLSLMPSLLEKVHQNIKAGHDQFAIYEIGKIHNKFEVGSDILPLEQENIALVFVADKKAQTAYSGSPYYQALHYAEYLLDKLGFKDFNLELLPEESNKKGFSGQINAPFVRGRSANIVSTNGVNIGVVGEIKTHIKSNLKLPEFSAGFELDIFNLQKCANRIDYQPLGKFPKTHQDISLRVKSDITHKALNQCISKALSDNLANKGHVWSVQTTDIYQKEESHKNITLRITLSHPDRTLVTQEVNSLLDSVAMVAESKLQAKRL